MLYSPGGAEGTGGCSNCPACLTWTIARHASSTCANELRKGRGSCPNTRAARDVVKSLLKSLLQPLLKPLLTAACVASHRSFAIVIQQLPERLRDPVCVFYLVLRALDTVEDDMAILQDVKVTLLRAFHDKCYDKCARLFFHQQHKKKQPAPKFGVMAARSLARRRDYSTAALHISGIVCTQCWGAAVACRAQANAPSACERPLAHSS